jgi:hypothetical protein
VRPVYQDSTIKRGRGSHKSRMPCQRPTPGRRGGVNCTGQVVNVQGDALGLGSVTFGAGLYPVSESGWPSTCHEICNLTAWALILSAVNT